MICGHFKRVSRHQFTFFEKSVFKNSLFIEIYIYIADKDLVFLGLY